MAQKIFYHFEYGIFCTIPWCMSDILLFVCFLMESCISPALQLNSLTVSLLIFFSHIFFYLLFWFYWCGCKILKYEQEHTYMGPLHTHGYWDLALCVPLTLIMPEKIIWSQAVKDAGPLCFTEVTETKRFFCVYSQRHRGAFDIFYLHFEIISR